MKKSITNLRLNPTKGNDTTSKLTTTDIGIFPPKILIGGAYMVAAASGPSVTMAATAKQANFSTSSRQILFAH